MTFDHVVLMASDLDASLPWWEAVMTAIGFRKTRDHVWVNEADQAVDLKQADEPEPGYRRYGPGMNHIAFQAKSRAEVERVRAEVAAAGFEVPEIRGFGETVALFLKDPDGMRVEVVAYA